MFYGDPTFGGAAALWNLMKEKDLLTFKPLEAKQERETAQQAQALNVAPKMGAMYEARPTYSAAPVNQALAQEQDMHRFRRSAAPLPQDVQAKIKTGGYDPVVSEEDDMDKLLKYMFMSELMAGMAGDPAPTPYTVQVGPAAREFTPYNMFS